MLMAASNDNEPRGDSAYRASLERQIERRRAKDGPYAVEIRAGVEPKWHVLVISPGGQALAQLSLVSRGFGIYQPFVTRHLMVRGRKVTRRYEMFPGYMFVFVWDISLHARRLLACPGVRGILAKLDGTAAVMPAEFIRAIQIREHQEDGLIAASAAGIPSEQQLPRNHRKRRGFKKTGPVKVVTPSDAGTSVTISTKSYWREVGELDSDARIGALEKALGLGS